MIKLKNITKSIVRTSVIVSTLFAINPNNLFSADDFANAAEEKNFIKNARQLIYEGKRSGEGYFNKDGSKLIFQSEREAENPFYQIYILDFNTGDVNRVSNGVGKTTCAWFNWTNDRVLYASSHHDKDILKKQKDELDFRASGKTRRYAWDYEPEMDIFSSKDNGTDTKQLTKALGYDAEGSYSADGKYIAFASNRHIYAKKNLTDAEKKQLELDPSFFIEIYIMNADCSNVKRLTNHDGYDGGPFFSPDGKKIIWRRFTADGHKADIFTMNIDGSDVKQMTDFNAMSWAPYYHPSGEYIVFASNKLGYSNFEVYMIDKNGEKEPLRVTYTDKFDGLPVFSPDGKKLVWTSSRTPKGDAQLFTGEWNHKYALEQLAKQPKRNESKSTMNYTPEIKLEELKNKVSYLASDELEGRMTGSEGIRLAARFVKNTLSKFNLTPLVNGKFEHNFEYIDKTQLGSNNSFIITNGTNKVEFKVNEDYAPHSSSDNLNVSNNAVFVGYGIKIPATKDFEYNSYMGMDVKGKTVMMFTGIPGFMKKDEYKQYLRYADDMNRIMIAREMGATGIIFISEREKITLNERANISSKSGLPVLVVNQTKLNDAIKELSTKNIIELGGEKRTGTATDKDMADFDLAAIRKSFDELNIHSSPNKAFTSIFEIKAELNKIKNNDNNIIAQVNIDETKFKNVKASDITKQYIFLGGHYDHLGKEGRSSLGTDSERNQIHNGADDNASGTSLVLELAEYYGNLAKEKPETFLVANPNENGKYFLRIPVFAFWSAEELGLIGSTKFIEDNKELMKSTIAYLNFDMVGMLKENNLSVQGLGSSDYWKKVVEKKNVIAGFNLQMSDDPYLPTDAMAFYQGGVPVMAIFTGLHEHYHKPSDDAENLNYEGMESIAKFSSNILMDMIKSSDKIEYKKVEMTSPAGGSRGFGVSLGTIPDYAADVKGVKITGTRTGSAAEQAGIKAGDIMIRLAGREVLNVNDFTNILSDLKAGEKYEVVITRGSENLTLTIIPQARK